MELALDAGPGMRCQAHQAVSILVFVELALDAIRSIPFAMSPLVSILVFVELALDARHCFADVDV